MKLMALVVLLLTGCERLTWYACPSAWIDDYERQCVKEPK